MSLSDFEVASWPTNPLQMGCAKRIEMEVPTRVEIPFAGHFQILSNRDVRNAARICAYIENMRDAFDRKAYPGHVTASAFIVDRARQQVLLTHHAKLDIWLPLGGHCDGIRDAHFVALKEGYEESGLHHLSPVRRDVFDIDIHKIPANSQEAAHLHFDIRYLFEADSAQTLFVSRESKALQWVRLDQLEEYTTRASVLVLRSKLRCL